MKWLLFALKNVLRNRRRSLMALAITAVGTAAVRDDAGRVSLRMKTRKEMLPVSRLYAELFRQM